MILVDTDILIDINRGRTEISRHLDELRATDTIGISIVTKMELIVGCRNKQEFQNTINLTDRLITVPVREQDSEHAAELLERFRLSHGLLIPDALIAATAAQRSYPLLTRNRKHFVFLPGVEIQSFP